MNPSTLNTRILRFSRTLLLPLGLLAGAALPAHAVTPFLEEFSAASLNAARWSLIKEGGVLQPLAGKLAYTAPQSDKITSSAIILRGIEPKYNESWEVVVDAVNSARSESSTWIGVAVLNSANQDDFVGLEIGWEVSGVEDRNQILSDFGTDGDELTDVVKEISSSKAALRVTFSSVTKVITLWYRTASGDAWKKHATFSTNNAAGSKRRGNWRMKTSGKFKIALYGGSGDSAVGKNEMSLDDFQIRNLK